MRLVVRVATVFLVTFGAGFLAYYLIGPGGLAWYASLAKPPLMPPDIVFGIVWTILYALMALAACIVWLSPHDEASEAWLRFYFVQLLLNIGWTLFFFGLNATPLAFTDGLVLTFIVFGLTCSGWEINRSVAYLMLPYFLWLVFAMYLTLGVWMLN
jgi:tryptophan-rich sensory protein